MEREHGDDLVTVHLLAALVDREHAVAVAVEGDAEVAAARRARPAQQREVGGAAAVVDVRGRRARADRVHVGAEPLERGGRDRRVRAVGAVQHDAAGRRGRCRSARRRGRRSSADDLRGCRSAVLLVARRRVEQRLDRLLVASVSLLPRSKSLTPLYSAGLCEAETTAPRSARAARRPGVGRTPAEHGIAARRGEAGGEARSSSRPGARVSRPTSTRAAAAQSATRGRAARRALA